MTVSRDCLVLIDSLVGSAVATGGSRVSGREDEGKRERDREERQTYRGEAISRL